MCLAIPGKILSVDGNYAEVDIMGITNKVNIQLLEKTDVGDYVLIHTGLAIQRIDEEYFNFLNEAFSRMLEEDEQNG